MKIKRWRTLLPLLMLAAFLFTAACAVAEDGVFGVVYNGQTVNLREGPSQSTGWLGTYPSGTWMAISGEFENWYAVTAPDGTTGYMSKSYVKIPTERWGNVGIVNNPKATSFLNLRQTPSYSARVLDIYYNGVPCTLQSRSGGWYYVKVGGISGYFREEYLTQKYMAYSDAVATVVTPGNTLLNLRSGPGKQYTSMKQFPGGSYVMVLQEGIDWWKVSIDGYVGYMDASFLVPEILDPGEVSDKSIANGGEAYAIVNNPRSTQVLNFRESANTTSTVLGQFRNGAKLSVLDQGTEWCRLADSNGKVGYMMTKYLTLYNLPATPTMTVTHPQRTFVYLRAMPSSVFGSIITRVPHNSKITVLVPSDDWVKVEYNGYTGYMMTHFLK